MPGAFGGLTRFNEEYASKFMVSPAQVIGFVIAIAVIVVVVKILWPVVL